MEKHPPLPSDLIPITLGIEGGGTKTSWTILDHARNVLGQGVDRSSNLHLLTDDEFEKLLQSISAGIDAKYKITAVGGAFAGCDTAIARQRAERFIRRTWPSTEAVVVGEDTHSAFAAAHGNRDGIIVIAGTGSNVQGRKGDRWERAGGWGHLFADFGGGYDIARRGLETAYRHFDATGETGILGEEFLQQTDQKSLVELAPWIMGHSTKTEIASLALAVFNAVDQGDSFAREVLLDGASRLADRVHFVQRRLALEKPDIGLMGSLFEKNSLYAAIFEKELSNRLDLGLLFVITVPGSVGAASMALQASASD